ncbi:MULTISPECIES: pyridoxal-dependent decarboxylase, exosortase A system-associated [unclassified Sphingomonas]|uniref:pyridoxal-dependent decarboxylase, exosortase A system-associated n=1 Tax=unclassified Sphingomonas TaxID=196159 RepID=UPI0006F2D445|nr:MULTISPECIES: pyridoxal-dependent decarboxylase, exosortase A system-associated [unclassified Sphingomonas]KQM66901.1 diaminopimelate decarboxylase [Sphingomonas sp. Leaf16]KQN17848.1 diaminopimelate decarboxylase [Sphingomonas sp. Leaf29]KQN23711.1 diaminopimelate decarboxylase [Sphingomonas sp. Leaf32]
MKPVGPIPAGFAGQSRLTVGGVDFAKLLERAGDTPAFLYDGSAMAVRVARLRAALPPQVRVHYAIKANPYPPLLSAMAGLVDGLDVASGGELAMALTVKPAAAISFAGPGKRDDELSAAITAGATLHVESEGEADRALAIGDRLGLIPSIAVRVNPDFELRGSGMRMGGRASPFGIDAVRVPALVRRLVATGADWHGFHIFAGSQTLDSAAIIDAQAATLALAGRLAEEAGAVPAFVNLGGGFGIPYFAGDAAVDVERIGQALGEALDRRGAVLADTGFAVELGRWLVGEAGVYCTRVIDVKESGGETFVVVDGGLHHQLAASGNFGTVVRRNYPVAVAERMDGAPAMTASVVGCLCTPLDRLADRVVLPEVAVGDTIVLFQAGAYGATASPAAFLGHPPAREVFVAASE